MIRISQVLGLLTYILSICFLFLNYSLWQTDTGIQGSKKDVDIGDQHVLVGEEEVKEGYTLSAVSVISASDFEMEEPSNGKIEETQKADLQEDYREVQSVVESSDGKLEDTQKVELKAEYKEVITQDVGEVEPVVESVREIVVDGNSESVDEFYSALRSSNFDKDEKSSEVVDSGKLEEEEKEVSDSVTEYDEPVVPLYHFNQGLEELVENSIGLESKEKEEKASLSSYKTNGIPSVVANEELKGIEETNFLSSDEINGSHEVLKNTVSKGIEETTLLAVDENSGVPEAVTDVVAKGIEETTLLASDASVDGASKENINDSLQPLDDAPTVDVSNAGEEGNKTEIPQSTGNPVSTLGLDLMVSEFLS